MTSELLTNPFAFGIAGFLLGWLMTVVVSRLNNGVRVTDRDPRDLRIRSLEAENRIAQADVDKFRNEAERFADEVKELAEQAEQHQKLIANEQSKVKQLRQDLTDSVKKTRELRAELADRATENVHAEAKIREVETELSIVQASTDLLSPGALDYIDEDDEDRTAVL